MVRMGDNPQNLGPKGLFHILNGTQGGIKGLHDKGNHKAQNEAKGQLLVKKAEAEGEKLRNRAMMGVGGSTIVALEAARSLTLSNITISTVETDLLDIDGMATKLGVPER